MKTTEKLTVNLWRILSILPALPNPSSSFYNLLVNILFKPMERSKNKKITCQKLKINQNLKTFA
jgi:hypothetical protein